MKNKELDEEKNPWTTLSKTEIYDNPWINVNEHQVLNPSGGRGIYGVVHFKNIAVGVVPIDSEGYTYLVGQYRYTLHQYSWEIPEGGCPMDEEPIRAAQRELLEETGLKAHKWTPMLKTYISNSVTDEVGYGFIAQELEQGEAEPEETEDLKVWRLPLEEAIATAMDGRITDSLSVMMLLKVQLLLINKICPFDVV